MDELQESRFERACAAALASLREERARCADSSFAGGPRGSDAARAWLADPSSAEDARRSSVHLATCVACLEAADSARTDSDSVDDEHWARVERRLEKRARPWLEPAVGATPATPRSLRLPLAVTSRSSLLAAAALCGALLGAGAVWLSVRQGPSSPVAEERGVALQIISPRGPVNEPFNFVWTIPFPVSLRYHVEVQHDGELLWSQISESATAEALPASPVLVARLRGLSGVRWRVVGTTPEGRVIATSEWTPISVPPSSGN